MKRYAVLLAVALMMGTYSLANAALIFYTTNLSGANENPPNNSAGTGTATILLDTAAHTLRVVISFTGLSAGTTASHIHCCSVAPANAGVATTTPTFAGFPLGVTLGSYDNVLNLTSASSWNPAFITANGGTTAGAEAALVAGLAASQAYLNIHSSLFPGGEIRGFLALAPAPTVPVGSDVPTLSQWGVILLIAALGVVGVVVMRRRVS
jgi:hypothetical protein